MKKLTILTEDELSEVVGGGEGLTYTVMALGQIGVLCGVGFALYELYKLYQKHTQYKKDVNNKLDDLNAKIEKLTDKK